MHQFRQGKKHFLFIHVNEWATIDSPDTIPISQAYALAALRKAGHDGLILGDYKGSPLAARLFRDTLLSRRPAVLGFSVYEENINRVLVWARYAKELDPDILVVLGGPQITFMPAEALFQLRDVDILCRGEAESVLPALAQTLANGGPLAGVPGITFVSEGAVQDIPPAALLDDLDQLPSPYLEDIINTAAKSRVILLTSRGCTSPCTFCYTTRASQKRVRFHSLDRVIAEIKHLTLRGIRDFWFADPNFAYSRSRLSSLLTRIIDECPDITFWCQTRYNLVDDELLGLLKKAGAHTMAFGLESADREVLGRIKKGLDPEQLARVIGRVQAAGIEVELFTLFGLPGESLAQACKTLDFVKANRVRISGNSISQQLHLFFGIPILDDPKAHGVTPLAMTKPLYQSICRDFATEAMSEEEIRQMSMLWRLNREDFADHLAAGTGLFEVAGFINANREALLGSRPEALLMLARIYLALEEFEAARQCLLRAKRQFPDDPEVQRCLARPLTAFRSKRRATAAPGHRVIYDCKGMLDGRVMPATEAYYQEAVLGDGRLLPDFEAGLHGMKTGGVKQFSVRFPADYGQPELAAQTVTFQAYLHQVLEPVRLDNPDQLADTPRNIYRFNDLAALRRQNENLYYLVLKDSLPQKLLQEMTDFLSLLNFYLRLGFRAEADSLVSLLPADAATLEHAARILLATGWPEKAAELLRATPGRSPEGTANLAKALIKMKSYAEAEQLIASPALSDDIQILDLRVGLAALQHQPVEVYLARMNELIDLQVRYLADA